MARHAYEKLSLYLTHADAGTKKATFTSLRCLLRGICAAALVLAKLRRGSDWGGAAALSTYKGLAGCFMAFSVPR